MDEQTIAPPKGEDTSPEEELLYLVTEGSEQLRAGRVEEARAHFARALEIAPDHEQARNFLGLSLFRLERFAEAREVFDGLIHDNPIEPSLRINLAMVFLKTDQLEEARHALGQVLDIAPDHARAAGYMGLVLERMGDLRMAAIWYERSGNLPRANEVRERMAQEDDDEAPPSSELDSEPAIAEAEPADDPPPPSETAPEPAVSISAPPSGDGTSTVEYAASTAPPLDDGATHSAVEAAALTAATAHHVSQPSEAPPPDAAGAARDASMGFTLDLKADDDSDTGALDPRDDDLADAASAAPAAERPPPDEERSAAPTPVPEPATTPIRSPPEVELGPLSAPEPTTPAAEEGAENRPLPLRRLNEIPEVIEPDALDSPVALTRTGLVVLPIEEIVYLRTDTIVSLTGQLEVEPINRRYRGRRTDSLFGGNESAMCAAIGSGVAILDAGELSVGVVSLSNEDLYLLESALLSFSAGIVWENGRLPCEGDDDLDIVHLRGAGLAVVGTRQPVMTHEVKADRPVTLHSSRLVGWNGQVVPYRGPFPGLPESAERPPIVRFEGTGRVLLV